MPEQPTTPPAQLGHLPGPHGALPAITTEPPPTTKAGDGTPWPHTIQSPPHATAEGPPATTTPTTHEPTDITSTAEEITTNSYNDYNRHNLKAI